MSGRDREEELAEIARRYAAYEVSGHRERWAGQASGYRLLVAERDAWVSQCVQPYLHGIVVDLGCGEGGLAFVGEAEGWRPQSLVGVDLLPGRLALAQARFPWATFIEASADELPLGEGTVSAVTAMTMLSSLTAPWLRKRVYAEINRVLMPGGALIVYDMRYPSPRNRAVRPVSARELRTLFPGWAEQSRTLTVLPPLARSRLAAGPRRYRLLARIPLLRSHVGIVLVKPG